MGPSNCAHGNTSPNDGTPANSGTCKGYTKPNYQNGLFGNPKDGVRDLPDVSLFAANGVWDTTMCSATAIRRLASFGAPCVGDPAIGRARVVHPSLRRSGRVFRRW